MNSIRDEWPIIAGCSMMAAALVYIASCGIAHAAPAMLRYTNPGTMAIDGLEVCSVQGASLPACKAIASICGAGATCNALIDLPHGSSIVSARSFAQGLYSPVSNSLTKITVDPLLCLADDVCRFDVDLDGWPGGTDFSRFVAAFGKSWLKP